jgi:hypothetical protein
LIAEAMRAAVDSTFAAVCGAAPNLLPVEGPGRDQPCVMGTISFFGDSPWAYTLILPQQTAVALAYKFAGFDIAFDSADMGDVVGELANVLAGDVVAQMEARGVRGKMSLPVVARGRGLEILRPAGAGRAFLSYFCPQGPFGFDLVSAGRESFQARRSGQ